MGQYTNNIMREYQLKPQSMTEDSRMTFGKHKGERLGDVPASYLLWVWDNILQQPNLKPNMAYLRAYIVKGFRNLERDSDYIPKIRP